jgi:hypothetical protein
MINIITKCNKENVLKDFESFFEKYVLARDFEPLDLSVLYDIDRAILIDKKTGTIKTKFGITDILHLSTGCKIVLSYLFIERNKKEFKNIVLDITECGSNALEVLFSCVDKLQDKDTVFLLRHSNQLLDCKERDYNVNEKICNSLYEGVVLYG